MNQFLHGVFRAVAETFPLPEPILEVGSYQVAGQEGVAELRGYFPGKEYLGIDTGPVQVWIGSPTSRPCPLPTSRSARSSP